MSAKHNSYYIKGGIYSVEMLQAIVIAIHMGVVTPLELKKYLDGNKKDAYNILRELVEANYQAYRSARPN